MTWFTASVVTYLKSADPQDVFPIFEDFILIEADNRSAAMEKAIQCGHDLEDLDDSPRLGGAPARRVFAGIRKLRSIYNPPPLDIDSDAPTTFTELSHSFFEVNSEDEVMQFAQGKALQVLYRDDQ
jgi:hypothetical protein